MTQRQHPQDIGMPYSPKDNDDDNNDDVENDEKNIFDEENAFDNDKYAFDNEGTNTTVEVSHDDDEIVNEVRIRHKCFYYCANMERKHYVGAILTVVTLIVIAMTSSTAGTRTNNNGAFSLSSWEDACSSPSLHTEDGYNRCYTMCSTFDCCDLPTDDNDCCSSSHSTECDKRESLCNGITIEDIIPYSNEQSVEEQEQPQYDGHWENEMQKDIQEEVEEAEMMEQEVLQVDEAMFEIKILDACSGDDLEKCKEYCADHMCCVIQQQQPQGDNEDQANIGENNESCVDDIEMNCDIYTSCSNLDTVAMENVDIDLVCSKDSDQDLEACRELCSERICCFVDGDENCQDSMKEWCDEYEVCGDVLAEVLAIGILPVGGGGDDNP